MALGPWVMAHGLGLGLVLGLGHGCWLWFGYPSIARIQVWSLFPDGMRHSPTTRPMSRHQTPITLYIITHQHRMVGWSLWRKIQVGPLFLESPDEITRAFFQAKFFGSKISVHQWSEFIFWNRKSYIESRSRLSERRLWTASYWILMARINTKKTKMKRRRIRTVLDFKEAEGAAVRNRKASYFDSFCSNRRRMRRDFCKFLTFLGDEVGALGVLRSEAGSGGGSQVKCN